MELVTFGFHPALKVTKITDEAGKVLTGDRSADGTIRVTPATPFVKGQVDALDLCLRRHHHRQRRRAGGGAEAGGDSGADQLTCCIRRAGFP